jgi:SAM-dependent methyltransferase
VAFEELKQWQSIVWGNGRFELVSETIADVHDAIVGALAPTQSERWLDLACGTGAVAERAARAGASVTGIDLAPALVETAKRRAQELGLEIDYRVGDCEDLADLEDAAYDVVSSTFGIMFCPDHAAAAGELTRVVRPGGRIGLANWTPEGEIAEQFRMLAPFQPPLPPGAGSPFDWGSPEYLEALLGNDFELRFDERATTFSSDSGEEAWQFFVTNFGPTKSLAESLDDERREELHRTWVEFFERRYRSDGSIRQPREYLLVLGTRR